MMKLETMFCSSLVKVMPEVKPEIVVNSGCVLKGERFSFQIAYRMPGHRLSLKIEPDPDSPLSRYIRIRKVDFVPVDYAGTGFDDDYLFTEPGLYPDLLSELSGEESFLPLTPTWRSAWITVDVPRNFKAGVYPVRFKFRTSWQYAASDNIAEECVKTFRLEVLDAVLPPQKLINTHWFYADCLASYYKVPVFSEEHWRIIGNYMKSAADHGINMLLTPVFTPPLDTMQGTERPTVQLVKVKQTKGRYSFDLTLLDRWIRLAEKSGIKYFEISHLFTQWGAYFTPKIIAEVNGREKRIFGWDVKASSPEYARFLDVFLPVLADFLKKRKLQKRTYFHCSDEPHSDHIESYKYDKTLLRKHLKGFKIMDALSDVKYYKEGIVEIPVPIESELEKFIDAGMKERWTYYCSGPSTVYSNRFVTMPSSRNRIFGAMLYKYDIQGFLNWGFNFYYSGLSRYLIDPFKCLHSGYFFPPGDGFLLYPGKDGVPLDSIRYEVFYEAIQDQRVMEALERYAGRDAVVRALDKCAPGGKLTMSQYPRGEKAVLALRAKINQLFRNALKKGK